MDILFLSHRIPYPPNKGDKIRSHALLTHLAKRHRVHVGCFVDDPADMAHGETLKRLAGGDCILIPLAKWAKPVAGVRALLSGQSVTTSYFGSARLSRWIASIKRRFEIQRTIVFCSAMAPYLLADPETNFRHAILDLVDIDSDKWRQYAENSRWPIGSIYRREARKVFALERLAAGRFGASLLASKHEADAFATLVPEAASRIMPLPNGVDRYYFAPGVFRNPFGENEQAIVMTGHMDYQPNVQGAEWFFRQVLPLTAEELPRARFYVVGANPPASLRALVGDKLKLTGRVEDVRPYLQHASAVIAPLRIARGVQNKVLEAMAMGRPVVSTRDACRSLEVTSGVHLWIKDSPHDFADALVQAVKGPERQAIAERGREYVELHHDWFRNLAVLDELLAAPATPPRAAHRSVQGPSGAPCQDLQPSIAEASQ